MKTITSFIASSLLAFTLVTAHGAGTVVSGTVGLPSEGGLPDRTLNPPTQADKNFFNHLQEQGAQPVILKLHENNDGAKFTIPSGTLVKVILDSNAGSTGYDWTQAFSSPTVLEFKNKKIKQAPRPLIGAPAQECWTFIATASGQTTLTFSLARCW